jgi:hypothetical protein
MNTHHTSMKLLSLGHGYTEYNLPYDGGHSIVYVKLQLSNNDFIIAKTFEWYNK